MLLSIIFFYILYIRMIVLFYILYSVNKCIISCTFTNLFRYWIIFQFYMNTYFCFRRKEYVFLLSVFIRYFYQLQFHLFIFSPYECAFLICCVYLINSLFYAPIIILLTNNLLKYWMIFQFYMNA